MEVPDRNLPVDTSTVEDSAPGSLEVTVVIVTALWLGRSTHYIGFPLQIRTKPRIVRAPMAARPGNRPPDSVAT